MKKRHIIITAVATFYLTALLCTIVGLRFILPNYVGSNGDFVSKFQKIAQLTEENFIFEYDSEISQEAALEGYLGALNDPYSEYISKAEYYMYSNMKDGEYKGIGVVVRLEDDKVIIETVNEGSPAQRAGVCAGDILKSVNGLEVNAATYNDALSIIRGIDKRGENDNLAFVLLRGDKEISLNIVRETITEVKVISKIIDSVGYIQITSFEGKAAQQFRSEVDSLIKKNVKGFVFDLRNNPGGSLDCVLDITDRVLDKGKKIITIKSKSGDEDVYKSEDDDKIDLPICVLINSNSASASEVFASALKDHGVAEIVGTKSFGKGIVQSIYELGDQTAVKLTTATYYTPNGVCIHGVGITPDKVIELDEEYRTKSVSSIPYDKDTQLKYAIKRILEK